MFTIGIFVSREITLANWFVRWGSTIESIIFGQNRKAIKPYKKPKIRKGLVTESFPCMFINSSINPPPTNRFNFRLFDRLGGYFDGFLATQAKILRIFKGQEARFLPFFTKDGGSCTNDGIHLNPTISPLIPL